MKRRHELLLPQIKYIWQVKLLSPLNATINLSAKKCKHLSCFDFVYWVFLPIKCVVLFFTVVDYLMLDVFVQNKC